MLGGMVVLLFRPFSCWRKLSFEFGDKSLPLPGSAHRFLFSWIFSGNKWLFKAVSSDIWGKIWPSFWSKTNINMKGKKEIGETGHKPMMACPFTKAKCIDNMTIVPEKKICHSLSVFLYLQRIRESYFILTLTFPLKNPKTPYIFDYLSLEKKSLAQKRANLSCHRNRMVCFSFSWELQRAREIEADKSITNPRQISSDLFKLTSFFLSAVSVSWYTVTRWYPASSRYFSKWLYL